MCSSLNEIKLICSNIKLQSLSHLEQLELNMDNQELKKIEIIQCNMLPSFNQLIYEELILKKISLDFNIPNSKSLIIDNLMYFENSLEYIYDNCETFKLRNMKKLKKIIIPQNIKKLTLSNIQITSIDIPSTVTYLHISECNLKELNVPSSCIKLKLEKCKKLSSISLPTNLTYLKLKKCPIDILSQCYLPLIPYEILKSNCLIE